METETQNRKTILRRIAEELVADIRWGFYQEETQVFHLGYPYHTGVCYHLLRVLFVNRHDTENLCLDETGWPEKLMPADMGWRSWRQEKGFEETVESEDEAATAAGAEVPVPVKSSKRRMHDKFFEFDAWLERFGLDDAAVQHQIKIELPELWADYRSARLGIYEIFKDGDEELFEMTLSHMRGVIVEIAGKLGIAEPVSEAGVN